MTGSARPLLFLDVDGVLLPFGASPREYPDGYPTYEAAATAPSPQPPEHAPHPPHPTRLTHPLLPRINPAHGPRLAALGCELVWATTWMDDANACVAPWLGLPQLPVVPWPDPWYEGYEEYEAYEPPGLHWKTRTLVAYAAGRPFIWLDDEITPTDRTWAATHHPTPALLHRVDARHGLTDPDFETIERWLRDHT